MLSCRFYLEPLEIVVGQPTALTTPTTELSVVRDTVKVLERFKRYEYKIEMEDLAAALKAKGHAMTPRRTFRLKILAAVNQPV